MEEERNYPPPLKSYAKSSNKKKRAHLKPDVFISGTKGFPDLDDEDDAYAFVEKSVSKEVGPVSKVMKSAALTPKKCMGVDTQNAKSQNRRLESIQSIKHQSILSASATHSPLKRKHKELLFQIEKPYQSGIRSQTQTPTKKVEGNFSPHNLRSSPRFKSLTVDKATVTERTIVDIDSDSDEGDAQAAIDARENGSLSSFSKLASPDHDLSSSYRPNDTTDSTEDMDAFQASLETSRGSGAGPYILSFLKTAKTDISTKDSTFQILLSITDLHITITHLNTEQIGYDLVKCVELILDDQLWALLIHTRGGESRYWSLGFESFAVLKRCTERLQTIRSTLKPGFDLNVHDASSKLEAKTYLPNSYYEALQKRNEFTREILKKKPAANRLFTYPRASDGTPLTLHDYRSLNQRQLVNDAVLNFYLKYLWFQISKTLDHPPTIAICNTFFYRKLVESSAGFSEVKDWVRHVDKKDIIVVPVNQEEHWTLAIICDPFNRQPDFFSGILYFDSLGSYVQCDAVCDTLKRYLTRMYENIHNAKPPLEELTTIRVKAPLQPYGYECGIFVLSYFEYWLQRLPTIMSEQFVGMLQSNKEEWFSTSSFDDREKRMLIKSVMEWEYRLEQQRTQRIPWTVPNRSKDSKTDDTS